MKPPELCDLCPWPSKPAVIQARIDIQSLDHLFVTTGVHFKGHLCEEHRKAIEGAVKAVLKPLPEVGRP